MNPINISMSFCPHVTNGKLRGWYLLAKRLFVEDTPILRKHQFLGFNGGLVVSITHPGAETLFEMITRHPKLEDRDVSWFGLTSLFPMNRGCKVYIPEKILKISIPTKIETTGIFRRHDTYRNEPFFYVEVPALTAEVLLGQEELI